MFVLAVPFQTAADDYIRGDVDQNGRVSIDDVTSLINYLLSGEWPEDSQIETETFTVNGVSFTMVKVEGGTFMMGATEEQGEDAFDCEYPVHQVTLDSYHIGQTEVTQELWYAVMGINPSGHKSSLLLPVENVSWDDCQIFINKLNELTGKAFRLPTEAEWEFAARGGRKSKGYKFSGSDTLDVVGWYNKNSSFTSHIVATKNANELLLYDMLGNVWEWCQDWWDSYTDESQINPVGPETGEYRVHRGGAYNDTSRYCRVSQRASWRSCSYKQINLGLRLALSF